MIIYKISDEMRECLDLLAEFWGSKGWKLDRRRCEGNRYGKSDYYVILDDDCEVWLGTGMENAKQGVRERIKEVLYFNEHREENKDLIGRWCGEEVDVVVDNFKNHSSIWAIVGVFGLIERYRDFEMHRMLTGHEVDVEAIKDNFLKWYSVRKEA